MSADDLVIVDLAAENAVLREHVALTDSYRLGLQVAIGQLAEQRQELETGRRRIAALVDENRKLRGSSLATVSSEAAA